MALKVGPNATGMENREGNAGEGAAWGKVRWEG